MSLPIQKLPSNQLGKDYIVGDLHGCFSLLERLMKEVSFNKNHDRLFSVGDLIDRGPESLRCLQLLSEPWFYAVKGNHEDMFLELFMVLEMLYLVPHIKGMMILNKKVIYHKLKVIYLLFFYIQKVYQLTLSYLLYPTGLN